MGATGITTSLAPISTERTAQFFVEISFSLFAQASGPGPTPDRPGGGDGIAFPWDIKGMAVSIIDWFFNTLVTGLVNAAAWLFTTGIEAFLFIDNPRNIEALNLFWERTIFLYFAILFVSMMMYWLTMMLAADADQASIQRMVKRLMISGLALVISRDLLAFFVELKNQIMLYLYPQSFNFQLALNDAELLVGTIGSAGVAYLMAIISVSTLILGGFFLYIILAIRMLVIYIVYAMFPVLIALWVVDIGPMKYAKFVGDFTFKLLAFMLIIGVFISGMLAVGAAVGDPGNAAVEAASATVNADGTTIISTDPHGPSPLAREPTGNTGSLDDPLITAEPLKRLFIFGGTILLIITLLTSGFGMLLSAGAGSSGGTGGFRGSYHRRRGGRPRPQPQQAWAANYQGNTKGSLHHFRDTEGNHYAMNPAGGGVKFPAEGDPLSGKDPEIIRPGEAPFGGGEPDSSVIASQPSTHSVGNSTDDIMNTLTGRTPVSAAKSRGGSLFNKYAGRPGKALVNGGSIMAGAGKAFARARAQPTVAGSFGQMKRDFKNSPITPFGEEPHGEVHTDGDVGAGWGGQAWRVGSGIDASQTSKRTPAWSRAADKEHPTQTLDHRKLNDEATEVIDEMGLPDKYDYKTIKQDEYINQMYSLTAGTVARKYPGISKNQIQAGMEQKISKEEMDHMFTQMERSGTQAHIAVGAGVNTMTSKAGDPIGEHMSAGYGGLVEQPTEGVNVEGAYTKVNLGKEGVEGGGNAGRTWRYEFMGSDKQVYAKQYGPDSGKERVAGVVSEEAANRMGTDTIPAHHYDPRNKVGRSEGVQGDALSDVMEGDGSVSKADIDRESFIDAHATSAMIGDTDVHGENLVVQNDGKVKRIDPDRAGRSVVTSTQGVTQQAEDQAEKLGLDVSGDDIRDRMDELANNYASASAEPLSESAPNRYANVDESKIGNDMDGVREDRANGEELSKTIEQNVEKVKNGKHRLP